jgi:hypothetical protein
MISSEPVLCRVGYMDLIGGARSGQPRGPSLGKMDMTIFSFEADRLARSH